MICGSMGFILTILLCLYSYIGISKTCCNFRTSWHFTSNDISAMYRSRFNCISGRHVSHINSQQRVSAKGRDALFFFSLPVSHHRPERLLTKIGSELWIWETWWHMASVNKGYGQLLPGFTSLIWQKSLVLLYKLISIERTIVFLYSGSLHWK